MADVIPLRVAVRARPLIAKETDEGCQPCLNFVPGEPQIVLGKSHSYTFDCVFNMNDPQVVVYEDAVKPLIRHIFKGYNATVLAYGQTCSGKTFTMGGGYEASLKMDPDGMGVIPRIVQDIFMGMQEKTDYTYAVKVSYLEIINEELQDLLVVSKNRDSSLAIREENGLINVRGLREVEAKGPEDIMRWLEQGCNNRTTASTAMNSTSSRSHAIFTLHIEQRHKEDVNDFWRSKLQLVDLAGSERVKKTHAEGERFKEGVNINKGLLCLGNVISALGDESQRKNHVNYRDSKLTRILQGGNSHTLMIACVSPADSNMEETLNTLRYADRARKIKNKPIVNWDAQTAEIMHLREMVQQLNMRLTHAGVADSNASVSTVSSSCTPVNSSPAGSSSKIRMWMDKVKTLEDENTSLTKQLGQSVDQAAGHCEKAIKWEMKCDRLKTRLRDFEEGIGVDFDVLSSSVSADTNPALMDQLEKLKALAGKVHETSGDTNSNGDTEEEEEMGDDSAVIGEGGDSAPTTPHSREMAKQHTLRRAKLNSELEELNQILEKKEKLANQMTVNESKMDSIKLQYEGNMKQLEAEVTSLQKEKETLSSALEDAITNTAASKVSEQRRKRMQELEKQMTDLKKKIMEQKQLLKLKDRSDLQVTKLNGEIQGLKQHRVKLIKQMKEDADQWRKLRQQKDREVIQLQQKDRKRQFEIQKLQRENQRTQNVLQRKSEEASAANRRLKEALSKQKKVIEERNQKFVKCDNAALGNRVRKWLSHELDVKVGVMEAKYHRESLMQDRKALAEQLKVLKESLDDDGPPSKRLAWMDDSGQKCQTSFQEEEKKEQMQQLQQEIELRNVQIADMQQKIFDADQESKGKGVKDNLHTMMEAKIAIKWLLDQAVSFKADNNRIRLEKDELKANIEDSSSDNNLYIEELEADLAELRKTHQSTIIKMRHEHQKEIEIILASMGPTGTSDVDAQRQIETQQAELKLLKTAMEDLKKRISSKEDSEKIMAEHIAAVENSPFVTPRPKPKHRKMEVEELLETDSESEYEEEFDDPDWVKTPLAAKIRSRRRKTDLFKQPQDKRDRLSSDKCGCSTRCSSKRCTCLRRGATCSDSCKCKDCENRENPPSMQSVSSSVLNTTFEVDSTASDQEKTSGEEAKRTEVKTSDGAVKKTKVPAKLKKSRSTIGRKALGLMQTGDSSLRSSDEFETKPMRKIMSTSSLSSKSSVASLKQKSSKKDVPNILQGGIMKKRKLHSANNSYFSPIE